MPDLQTTNMKCEIRTFRRDYATLTGYAPLRWQERLFRCFVKGELPSAIDLPTGLGKTAVMALWLIARAYGAPLPRRLAYVVDRRAVVDQATTFAATLREKLDSNSAGHLKKALVLADRSLSISTLRGQHVDNREWLDDPAATAIIVGTIDMVGSRLLFEGYGVSRKMRPYHAGLLGTDTLFVLDEAHLTPPFEKLIHSICDPDRFGPSSEHKQLIPGSKLMSLSATARSAGEDVFRLKGSFKSPSGQRHDLDDPIVTQRMKARKRISFLPVKTDQLAEELTDRAWSLSARGSLPIRCIVFSHSREVAETARIRLDELAGSEGKHVDTELLVGARRVHEREAVAQWLENSGFIAGSAVRRKGPAFLFATSAGEVGVDLDADHMVCDLVPWERMVQRLGRVNRRGDGDAQIIVLMSQGASETSQASALA